MKITSVELRPEGSSEVIELSFRDPKNLDPYQVKSIAPLDADELTPQFYGTSGDSAKKYYNLALKQRQPVVLIGLNPRFGAVTENSYSELRDRLFRLISSSRTGIVKIVFKNGLTEVAAISGTVAKLEASLFTENPEVQITFNCPDPMLKSISRRSLLTAPSPLTLTTPLLSIPNGDKSTAPSGFRFIAEIEESVSTLVIKPSNSSEWSFVIKPHLGGFLSRDILHFSSENRNKYLYFMRGSVKTHLADVIGSMSIWPIIFPSDNAFDITKVVGSTITPLPLKFTSISHYLTYWGV